MEGGPPVFAPGFTCPGLLVNRPPAHPPRKGLSPARAPLSSGLRGRTRRITPAYPAETAVWAAPASLAATEGISVDLFSSGYLDVSIPRVCLPIAGNPRLAPGGFSHSESLGSMAGAPRQGVSPLPASFFAGRCLGIPRVRYVVVSHLMLAGEASKDICSIYLFYNPRKVK